MKRVALLTGLLIACLCLAQNAKAQFIHQIQRNHADFLTQDGRKLSDVELIDLVGENVFSETVVGARKQFNSGKWLIIGGSIGLAAGELAGLSGIAILSLEPTSESDLNYDYYRQKAIGRALFYGSCSVFVLGGLALSAGIPLRIIGRNRLNWVEENYNGHQNLSCSFGLTDNGFGLALNF